MPSLIIVRSVGKCTSGRQVIDETRALLDVDVHDISASQRTSSSIGELKRLHMAAVYVLISTRLLEINRALVDRIHARARLMRAAPRWDGIEGWLSPNEAYALYRHAHRLPRGATALEIGSWKGKSTYCIARGLRDGRLICIDPFDASGDGFSAALYTARAGTTSLREQFEATMTAAGVRDRLDVRQGTSDRFVGTVGPLDMLFIDGNHEYEACRSDFSGYSPSLRPGGALLFHDYDPSKQDSGPTMLIDQTIVPSGTYNPIDVVDSLWIGIKAAPK